eukprot:scaffold68267_cov75-Phaeocystis_antarctica.AAC.3
MRILPLGARKVHDVEFGRERRPLTRRAVDVDLQLEDRVRAGALIVVQSAPNVLVLVASLQEHLGALPIRHHLFAEVLHMQPAALLLEQLQVGLPAEEVSNRLVVDFHVRHFDRPGVTCGRLPVGSGDGIQHLADAERDEPLAHLVAADGRRLSGRGLPIGEHRGVVASKEAHDPLVHALVIDLRRRLLGTKDAVKRVGLRGDSRASGPGGHRLPDTLPVVLPHAGLAAFCSRERAHPDQHGDGLGLDRAARPRGGRGTQGVVFERRRRSHLQRRRGGGPDL